MSYPFPQNQQHFIYRLALEANDKNALEPSGIIASFFELGNITEIKRLFMAACRAALTERYNWRKGSPGNLLYIYEQLELLLEACFIIYSDKKKIRKLGKKLRRLHALQPAPEILLPSSLSAEEIRNPVLVLKSFFDIGNLKEWKRALYAWLEAGLSDYDVLQNVEIASILPYHVHLQRLMDACWYIHVALSRNKQ